MPFFKRCAQWYIGLKILEVALRIVQKHRLVFLEPNHIVGFLGTNRLNSLLLTAHSVRCDNRVPYIHQVQQLRHGYDFVAFPVYNQLTQGKLIFGRKGADDGVGVVNAVSAASDCFFNLWRLLHVVCAPYPTIDADSAPVPGAPTVQKASGTYRCPGFHWAVPETL